ncbi:hypothetical protein L3Q82_021241 [Scortum barcoo]|uniref:Uncharacterized protein n=1 Tax=Scortum barcoo TaxID=214431 RepID=A0ACB8X4M1_9TELE|nr:hypothetical protein L3Q82_021241 [Scortum barcoo]
MFITVILGLLVCTEARGSITETLFVQTGKDLLLDVKEPVVLEEGSEGVFAGLSVCLLKTVVFSVGVDEIVIPSITEKPMKSFCKIFDCRLKDAKAVQATIKELESWLSTIDKSDLPVRYKAWIYQHGILPQVLWPLLVYELDVPAHTWDICGYESHMVAMVTDDEALLQVTVRLQDSELQELTVTLTGDTGSGGKETGSEGVFAGLSVCLLKTVVFSVETHSLLLKSVQKIDSGDYTAVFSGENDQPVAKYKVTVQVSFLTFQLEVDASASGTGAVLLQDCASRPQLLVVPVPDVQVRYKIKSEADIDSSILLGQYQAGSLALTSTHPILSSVVGESVRLKHSSIDLCPLDKDWDGRVSGADPASAGVSGVQPPAVHGNVANCTNSGHGLMNWTASHSYRRTEARRADKRKGGGLAVFVNDRWCNPGHITIKEQHCCKDIELLAVSMRPYYLPREFTHALVVVVYVHNKTLDLFYANTKEAYHSLPLPPLGRADHNLVHLLPVYKTLVHRQPAVTCTVKKWSEEAEAEAALKDCFNTTLWDVFSDAHGEDIDSLTHCLTACVTVRSFSNSKALGLPRTLRLSLKEKRRAFVSGNKEELKSVQRELRRMIRKGKNSYRRKMEHQLQQNNICGVWKGLKTISGFKEPKSQPVWSRRPGTLERLVLAHLRPLVSSFMDPLQFAYQPDIGVDDAVIYLLHTSLTHLEKAGSTVRIMFFDFSSAFNTIQPRLLGDKLQLAGVDHHLTTWILDYLTHRTTVCEGAPVHSTAGNGSGSCEKGQLCPGMPPGLSRGGGKRNGRMMAKLSSLLNNTSHPLQDTLTALGSSFSERLLHPRCVKESQAEQPDRDSTMFITVILGLLVCTEARGSITETLFVQTGKDLLLDVKEACCSRRTVDDLTWRFNNVQKIDSGDYTAVVSGAKDQLVAKYKVTVQGSEGVFAGLSVCLLKTVVFSVGLIIMVSVVIAVHLMKLILYLKSVQKIAVEITLQVSGENDQPVAKYKVTVQGLVQTVSLPGFYGFLVKTVGLFIMVSAVISVHLMEYQAGSLAPTSTHPILSSVVGESVRLEASLRLFVQTGNDLLLDVKGPVVLQEGFDLFWRVNGSTNIAKLPYVGEAFIFKSYTGRAELSAQTQSLHLKNVQKIDSGDYTAVVLGENDKLVAEYKVTVQGEFLDISNIDSQKFPVSKAFTPVSFPPDPVSPVKVTVSSCSSESCNLTVTCSTVDAHISSTFRCDRQTCSEEGGERSEDTTRPSSITVYLEQGFIICNHSNHVSWKQDKKKIKSFC